MKIDIQQSWWAMNGLGNDNREWTMEEKFEKIAEAGFTGIMGELPEEHDMDKWRRLLDEYQFSFGIHSFPSKREDLQQLLTKAKEFGVQYVSSQVMDDFIIGEEAVQLLKSLVDEAKKVNIPYFVETHRGRITQDLIRTVNYVKEISDLRLTVDLSHYVVAGEGCHSKKAEECFDILLKRTSSIHARVSNGHQIQIDIGSDGNHPMTERFVKWWEKGMSYWLQEANQGDVLPLVCELGPPDYSITKHTSIDTIEISDRWEQAIVFKRILEEAWGRVVQSHSSVTR
ncbi:sugar phosphate isomerase/epimerase family protein [Metabacillus schmidteae]|uniref:sugar phosphate isomerase/epimerase family protein n=1 Tax=Metabacillus schmidteae TaxID=2730405 RepID=UPI001F38D8DA|nr:TIM barrel protein [Metabacillus schmidteae]